MRCNGESAGFPSCRYPPSLSCLGETNCILGGLLVTIGIAGFLLQFLLTEGLQREKAGRATNMIVGSPSHNCGPGAN